MEMNHAKPCPDVSATAAYQAPTLSLPLYFAQAHARSYPKDLYGTLGHGYSTSITTHTCDEVHRNQDGTQCSQLREHIVDLIVCICHLDGDLC